MLRAFSVVSILILGCSTFQNPSRGTSSEEPQMDYVEVCGKPNTCKRFSRLVMGTDHLAQADWTQPGQPEPFEEEIFKVLDEAAKLGINLFDTSPIYVGGIENKLGKWLLKRNQQFVNGEFTIPLDLNPDRKLYALSKGGFPFDLYYSKKLAPGSHSLQLRDELRKRGILSRNRKILQDGSVELTQVPPGTYASRLFGSRKQIEGRVLEELGHSNANLNKDIAVYLMHRDDGDFIQFSPISRPQTSVAKIMEALTLHQNSNQFSLLGWSNWTTDRVNQSIQLANAQPELTRPVLNSPYFSLFEMSSRTIHAGGVQVTHKEMMNPDFQKGIHIMPYSPLGGFSIFDKTDPKWENAKKIAKEKFDAGDAYWQNVYPAVFTSENEARFHRVVEFTQRFNELHGSHFTIDQMINAYALAHPRTDFLAVGPITVEQLRRTVASLKLSRMLTVANLEYLHSGKPL